MRADKHSVEDVPLEQAELAAEVFRLLSDATRVRLVWALIGQERAVNELAERIGRPAPSISQHLAKLRMARLVRTRREGTQAQRYKEALDEMLNGHLDEKKMGRQAQPA